VPRLLSIKSQDKLMRKKDSIFYRLLTIKLSPFGENAQEKVNFICNCCGCCCEAMLAAKDLVLNPVHTTNYLPEIEDEHATDVESALRLSGRSNDSYLS